MSNVAGGGGPPSDENSKPTESASVPVEGGLSEDDVGDQMFASPGANVNRGRGSGQFQPTPLSALSAAEDIDLSAIVEDNEHVSDFTQLKNSVESFYGPNPLGAGTAAQFSKRGIPMPVVPTDEQLIRFRKMSAPSEISPDELNAVKYALKFAKFEYDSACTTALEAAMEALNIKKAAQEKEQRRKSLVAPTKLATRVGKHTFSSQEWKTISSVTKSREMDAKLLSAIVKWLNRPGHANLMAIFEEYTAGSANYPIDPKIVAGSLRRILDGTTASNYAHEGNAHDLPEDATGYSIVGEGEASRKTNGMERFLFNHAAQDAQTLFTEGEKVKNRAIQEPFVGKSVEGNVARTEIPAAAVFNATIRQIVNEASCETITDNMVQIARATGANASQLTKCETLRIAYVDANKKGTKSYFQFPLHEELTLLSYLLTISFERLNICVNLLIELANIFNPADIRSLITDLGLFFAGLAINNTEKLESLVNSAEEERKRMMEMAWKKLPPWLAKSAGIVIDEETNIPLILLNSDFIYAYTLYQAYNCRGPNDGIGGIGTTRTAAIESIKTVCKIDPDLIDPLKDVRPEQMKPVFEKLLEAPSSGTIIDPEGAIDRVEFHDGIRDSSALGLASYSGPSAGYGHGEGGGARAERGRSTGAAPRTASKGVKFGSNSDGNRSSRQYASSPATSHRAQAIGNATSLERNDDLREAYRKEATQVFKDIKQLHKTAAKLHTEFKNLSKFNEKQYGRKFDRGCFKEKGNGNISMPLRPVFDGNYYELFRKDRDTFGQCPSTLWARYCVYADLFNLTNNGKLTAYGVAYSNLHDENWEKKVREFASKHQKYVPNAPTNIGRADGSTDGGAHTNPKKN